MQLFDSKDNQFAMSPAGVTVTFEIGALPMFTMVIPDCLEELLMTDSEIDVSGM